MAKSLLTLWDDDCDLFFDLMGELGLIEEYQALTPAEQKELLHRFAEIGRAVDRLIAEADAQIREALDQPKAKVAA